MRPLFIITEGLQTTQSFESFPRKADEATKPGSPSQHRFMYQTDQKASKTDLSQAELTNLTVRTSAECVFASLRIFQRADELVRREELQIRGTDGIFLCINVV